MASDWFDEMTTTSSVHVALDSLVETLDMRRSLASTLRQHLTPNNKDRLSDLNHQTSILRQTIDGRLPYIDSKKATDFFKRFDEKPTPVPQAIKTAPLLSTLSISPHLLMDHIERSWRLRQKPQFISPGCVWYDVLELQQTLQHLRQLPAPWAAISFDKQMKLHTKLKSASLEIFLKSITQEIQKMQNQIEHCYWSLHRKTKDFSKKCPHHQWSIKIPAPPTPKNHDLEFFKFKTMPSGVELKKRYYQLARIHHPDIPGGSPESFQRLQKAYQRLATQCTDARS